MHQLSVDSVGSTPPSRDAFRACSRQASKSSIAVSLSPLKWRLLRGRGHGLGGRNRGAESRDRYTKAEDSELESVFDRREGERGLKEVQDALAAQ